MRKITALTVVVALMGLATPIATAAPAPSATGSASQPAATKWNATRAITANTKWP